MAATPMLDLTEEVEASGMEAELTLVDEKTDETVMGYGEDTSVMSERKNEAEEMKLGELV